VKDRFVKLQEFRVNLSEVRLALREMAVDLRNRKLWLTIAGIILLVAVAGPFYTLENLGLAGRIAYWGAVGVLSWLMMWTLARITFALTPAHWSPALIGGLAGVIGVVPVMALVAVGNIAFGMGLPARGFWGFAPYVAPPVIGISILAAMLSRSRNLPPQRQQDSGTASDLFARLPPELGRDIVALQAQDHYVHVTTSKGNALVLLRMSDAVNDLNGFAGLQIHRSWWVNLRHASHLEKSATGRVQLVMDNGLCVPVPRSRQSEVKRLLAAAATDSMAQGA
jgi:hypothetical protein